MSSLPSHCNVLVIGAGPAGSACAQLLAARGASVVLVDQQTFPRDKICGDGLIPDAHAALARLGVADEVKSAAHPVAHVRCVGPRGGAIDVPGRLAVLPRVQLDDILLRAAVRAGAQFHAPWRYESPLRDNGRVVGAVLRALPPRAGASAASGTAVPGEMREVRADWVVLATGAPAQGLVASDLCERRVPSAIALRGYIRHPGMADALAAMHVVWHKRLRPGYGWIFPVGNDVYNVGVGILRSERQLQKQRNSKADGHDGNLHALYAAFCEAYVPAKALADGGTVVGEFKGAPLRCSLQGAAWSANGVLVAGEAAGSTYSFTGEGIGKAMETGLLAAEALLAARRESLSDAAVRERYEAGLMALKPRFDLYDKANRINEHPWLADLVIWRAHRSASLRRRMAGVLEETSNPGYLVSWYGISRLLMS